jgi:hypothetical protein
MNKKYSNETIKALYEGSRLKGIKHKFLAEQYGIPSISYVSDLIRTHEKENNL